MGIVISCIIIVVAVLFMRSALLGKSEGMAEEEKNKQESSVTEQENIDNKEMKAEPEVYSDFQRALQENTRTLSQVIDDENKKLINEIKSVFPKRYECMKNELMEKAKNGEYKTDNGKKIVTVDYDGFSYYIHKCTSVQRIDINRSYTVTVGGPCRVKCTISNKIVYNELLNEVRKYTDKDNIKFEIILRIEERGSGAYYSYHNVPCDDEIKHSFANSWVFLVRATVRY